MRTGELLSLQRRPDQVVHRDELLFQVTHQATELWLKLACAEVSQATRLVGAGLIEAAMLLLERALLAVRLVTEQLEMLRHLALSDFQVIRTALGNGSGFESPGWRGVHRVSRDLDTAFGKALSEAGVTLLDVYRGSAADPLFRLAEALVSWDERIGFWRVQHYQIAVRMIGAASVGTHGTPVDVLAKRIDQRFFPDLWQVRNELTDTGPMAASTAGSPR